MTITVYLRNGRGAVGDLSLRVICDLLADAQDKSDAKYSLPTFGGGEFLFEASDVSRIEVLP